MSPTEIEIKTVYFYETFPEAQNRQQVVDDLSKDKDEIEAQYALESSSQPLGISSYELSNLIPDNYKGSMPTIEEIEAELAD